MEQSQEGSEKWYLNRIFLKIVIPIILVIVLFIVKRMWGNSGLSFMQENKLGI